MDRKSRCSKEIALAIQGRAKNKDKNFILTGKWKRTVGIRDGFKICAVDGEWIRNNISILYGAGGHGYVHEFIPLNEIWVSTRHFPGCGCGNLKSQDQFVSQQYFESTAIHEITESKEMEKGLPFWKAHEVALQMERDVGILKDPHTEVD
jgi:hypothetical protein